MLSLISHYIKEKKWVYLLIALSLLVYDASLVIPTKVVQIIVDQMANSRLTKQSLIFYLAILVGATMLSYIAGYLWHLKLFQEAVGFKCDLQQRAFRKLVFMRTPFYEKFRSGDMMTHFSTDVEGLMDLIGYGLMIVLYAGGMIAFIIPTMFVISWKMTLLGMLPVMAMMGITYYISKRQDLLIEEAREAIANLSDEVLETVEGIRVMRAYSQKDYLASHFQEKTKRLADRWNKIASYRGLYFPISNVMIMISTVFILLSGFHFIEQGQVSLGQVIALQLYLVSLVEPFSMLSDFILVYQTGKTSFHKLNELIETGDDLEVNGSQDLDSFEQIVLKNYYFSYANSHKASLSAINLQITKGQTLGIVGKTGAGKTTLVRQLLRQYPVGEGDFLINGQNILCYDRHSLESRVGYVPQEHTLFSRTVLENIAMGKSGASLAEVSDAIETACFSSDIAQMSKGLEPEIGERGLSISGGQKQRISIARAFLSQPDLLILDDSLSAVDAKTERAIIEHIQEKRQGKTTLIVSHRLSAVQHADWIIVLDQGRIIEEGDPIQLLNQKGWYYQQYQRQQAQED
ncbi:ABC transporter ATP-binding protein [Streptococcus ictaluri]|uniref:ABC transporter transmembrane region n=1 Tax=Streptococcus ictaluri 707-05 TaxID=764299 RepID=G5K3K2_9STRE|nr:ABC transporter ATP-binding protein [Streptococcus ictaluri]EHI69336.1 ABC transporter transmembrane region [Streptococcus ictaluri 707-05]